LVRGQNVKKLCKNTKNVAFLEGKVHLAAVHLAARTFEKKILLDSYKNNYFPFPKNCGQMCRGQTYLNLSGLAKENCTELQAENMLKVIFEGPSFQ
jgi:hypothetical protein